MPQWLRVHIVLARMIRAPWNGDLRYKTGSQHFDNQPDAEALKADSVLRNAYELTWLGAIGCEKGDKVRFLSRLIRCNLQQGSSAIFVEPGRRHVDLPAHEAWSVDVQMQQPRSAALPKHQSSLYPSQATRAAYLFLDRLGMSHAVKNGCVN